MRKALGLQPKRLYCWFHLAVTLSATGRATEAAECIDTALSLAASTNDQEELSVASSCCQLRAEDALERGDYDGGLMWADKGLWMCENNYSLLWVRARALLGLDRLDACLDAAEPLLAVDPFGLVHETHSFDQSLFTVDTPGLVGAAHFERGDDELAENYFAQAASAAQDASKAIEFNSKAHLARLRPKKTSS
ncbi:MAG: hypothetical protein AAF125_21630 [Chloroflexota bacterium]